MKKTLYRKGISTAQDLANEICEVGQLYNRTDDKYLIVNGLQVVAIEVVETTLTDGSTVQDIVLLTEVG